MVLWLRVLSGQSWWSATWLLPSGLAIIFLMAFGSWWPIYAANPSLFQVKSYGGKCLDYGTRPGDSGTESVFLNDCTRAHPIGVEEIDANHDVVLYAGSQVIGIHNPPANTTGGPPPPPPTEYALELQPRAQAFSPDKGNQIFALDGDSIILTASRPCINSDQSTSLCPPPPPQIVVQTQNGRGADFSPIVAAERHLASFEFWDFNAVDGSGRFPTSGFVTVSTNQELWNAVCKAPAATSDTPPLAVDPGQPDDGFYLAVKCRVFNVGPGSVIVVQDDVKECAQLGIGACVDLSYYPPVILPSGVTLRSDRRGTNFGSQIYGSLGTEREVTGACEWCMLEVHGDYVRITGLRLRGQSRSPYAGTLKPVAIAVDWVGPDTGPLFGVQTTTEYVATIDHNDISDWESATVEVDGPYGQDVKNHQCNVLSNGAFVPQTCSCTMTDPSMQAPVPVANDPATLANVRVVRNFLHHNEQSGAGYGSALNNGGRAVILGNTFLANRHAITSPGEPHDEYLAWYNLVLTYVPDYTDAEAGDLGDIGRQQDFDMHGSGLNSRGSSGYGWTGGYGLDIAANTFLGGNRFNFELRGHPCHAIFFRDNVTQQSQTSGGGGVINFHDVGDPGIPFHLLGPNVAKSPVTMASDPPVSEVFDEHNQFGDTYINPGVQLAVGDFDGDGVQDLFMATGTAWYSAPGGTAEWRFLNAQSYLVSSLLFGDFDGDGRTDVVVKDGDRLLVSWGGESNWEVLNPGPITESISDMAVGHFTDRDTRKKGPWPDDIFLADGKQWLVSTAGSGPFTQVQTSSFRVKDLRFGNFDQDPKTDVMGVVGGKWQFSSGARSSWTPMAVSLTGTVDHLVVADFNGDGLSDIATNQDNNLWMVSYGGANPWSSQVVSNGNGCTYLGTLALGQSYKSFDISRAPGIGRFKGTSASEVLIWNNGNGSSWNGGGLCIVNGMDSSTGPWTLQPWSRQDMN
jgi:hypothetical protein